MQQLVAVGVDQWDVVVITEGSFAVRAFPRGCRDLNRFATILSARCDMDMPPMLIYSD
jgi:hypothetical protein